jgi:sugar phosphate isomerase/epimerase
MANGETLAEAILMRKVGKMIRKDAIGVRISTAIIFGVLIMSAIQTTASEKSEGKWEVILCNPLLHQLDMESTWAAAKAVGVRGIEITVDPDLSCSRLFVGSETPYRLDTPENARKIRQDAQAQGLTTPVLCAPIQLEPSKEKSAAPAWAKKLIEIAPHAGATLIYFPVVTDNFTKPTIQDDVFVEAAIAMLKELVAHGRKHGVTITIENLSVYWNRPEITRQVLKVFKPDEFGLCLDPTNMYWFGHPRTQIYEIVRELVPRARHFHAKNVAHPEEKREAVRPPGWEYGKNSVPVAEGDLDFGKILIMLREAGYNGCVSIEDDSLGHYPKEQRVEILRQDVQYLRNIIEHL